MVWDDGPWDDDELEKEANEIFSVIAEELQDSLRENPIDPKLLALFDIEDSLENFGAARYEKNAPNDVFEVGDAQTLNQRIENMGPVPNEELSLFQIRLTGNTVARDPFLQDKDYFAKATYLTFKDSLEKDFKSFQELAQFMASRRSLIQKTIYEQTCQYNLALTKLFQPKSQEGLQRDLRSVMKEACRAAINDPYDNYGIEKFLQASLLNVQIMKENFNQPSLEIFEKAINEAISVVQQETPVDFGKVIDDIFLFENGVMEGLSMRVNSDSAPQFGRIRQSNSSGTPFKRYIADYKQKVEKLMSQDKENMGFVVIRGKIDGVVIPLTASGTLTRGEIWLHTDPLSFPLIFYHLENLYQDADRLIQEQQSGIDNSEALLTNAAEIHWWFANMMPYDRGSAAVGHLIAAHMMAKAGIEFSRVKEHVCIDIDSFLNTIESFVKQYPDFFESINY